MVVRKNGRKGEKIGTKIGYEVCCIALHEYAFRAIHNSSSPCNNLCLVLNFNGRKSQKIMTFLPEISSKD